MDNSIIIIFLIAWLVFRFVGSANRKKAGNQQGQQQQGQQQGAPGQAGQQQAAPGQTPRQQQAAELQKRLREAYEAAQQQQQQAEDDIPPYRRVAMDDDIPPYRRVSAGQQAEAIVLEKHHLDAEEEERCAAAARAKEEQREQQRQLARQALPLGGNILRQQAQQAELEPPDPAPLYREMSLASAPSGPPYQRPAAAAWPRGAALPREALRQGIIMAEILGPPRAKRRLRG